MITGLWSLTVIGFVVGMRHAMEPDHLAAVATLATASRNWRSAARLGIAWGGGHTLSVGVVAGALVLLGLHIPPRLFTVAELGVAAMLVFLGVSTLWAEGRRHLRSLGPAHAVAHRVHARHLHPEHQRGAGRALAFGLAHGLAGSGAVIVLLVSAATSVRAQFAYLLAFGLGTVAGMTCVTLATGLLTDVMPARRRSLWTIRVGAALASTAIGLMLGWRTLQG